MEQVFGLLDLSDLILDYLDHHSLGQLRASSLFFKNLVNSYVAAHTAKGTIRGLARVYEQTVPQRWSLKDRPDTVAFDEKLTFVPYFRTPRWSVGKLQPHTHEERHLMLFDSETQVFTRLKMKYVNDEYDEDILAHFHEFPESRSTENSAFAIHNNCLYMFGGWACWFQYNDIWVFDLSTLKWREIIPEGAVRGSDTYWDFMETDVLWCCDTSAAYFVFEDRCYFEDSDEHHGFWVFDFATEKWTIEAFTRIPENKQRLYWMVNTPLPLGQANLDANIRFNALLDAPSQLCTRIDCTV
eukprot:c9541_g1_i2.p1 GENE.c9541_g1_i2~~c9541_g1_i2.p1  ORF type:complete len:298 (+),score=33.25 c9541_g1_i2:32-925(+)